MKYIDTDRLKAEIERRMTKNSELTEKAKCFGDRAVEDNDILVLIESLQQEQLQVANASKMEQPEVDLDKFTEKIKTFQARYKHPENISIKGVMAFMARMFYRYPNVARQWYEQLPKATMD